MTFAEFRHRLIEILPPLAVSTLRLARTEAAALGAFLVTAMGALLFLELAEEMAEQGDRGLDYQVLEALRVPGDVGNPVGPWWVEEAAADLTALGGISVLSLFTVLAVTHTTATGMRMNGFGPLARRRSQFFYSVDQGSVAIVSDPK